MKKKNKKPPAWKTAQIVWGSFFFVLFLFPFSFSLASAQSLPRVIEEDLIDPSGQASPYELTAVPPRAEITGKPGETIQKTIKVKNGTKTTQYVESFPEDFIIDSDGKTPIAVSEGDILSDRFSLASWITVSPAKFSLRPNQTQVIDVVIQVPEDALPGGHYAMVLHQKSGTKSQTGTAGGSEGSTSINSRVGTLMYVTVEGAVNEEAYIRNLNVSKFQEFGPVPVSFAIENRSDVHIRPMTSVEIYDMFGQKVFASKVDEKNIFPFSVREFSSEYEAYWGLGRYKAKVVSAFGTQGKVTQASSYFWIVPYKLIIGIFILILTAVATWIAVRRHLHHRNDSKTEEIELLKKRVKELEQK